MVSYHSVPSYCGKEVRLNPCCDGRWSRTNVTIDGLDGVRSLNPCCDGRWSRTQADGSTSTSRYLVLILVVMEDGLVHVTATSVTQLCLLES